MWRRELGHGIDRSYAAEEWVTSVSYILLQVGGFRTQVSDGQNQGTETHFESKLRIDSNPKTRIIEKGMVRNKL